VTESNVQPGVLLPLSTDEVAFLLAAIAYVRNDDYSPHRLVEWLARMNNLEAKLLRAHWPDGRIPESR
jgi:hypothetical protein